MCLTAIVWKGGVFKTTRGFGSASQARLVTGGSMKLFILEAWAGLKVL